VTNKVTNHENLAGIGSATGAHPQPKIRRIGFMDLKDALTKGFADFNVMPTHLFFLCLVYPIVTIIVARTAAGYDLLPLVFPLLAGYTLIGPLIACGMYELSRRRERGLDISRRHAFEFLKFQSIGGIAVLGLVLTGVYFGWLFVAQTINTTFLGAEPPATIEAFVDQVFNTPEGLAFIVVGNGVGFLFAVLVFTVSVVSFPMLLDRDVGVATAVGTSIRAVLANPLTMAVWGVIVAVTLVAGSLPFFVGLAVAMPVLGHATWHLYRRVVEY
jgi:uncharacterized membrane protein